MASGTRNRDELTDERLKVIDPLGEIRAFAHQLWIDAGSPGGQDWRDFFEQAERGMTEGSGQITTSSKFKRSPTLQEIDRRFLMAVQSSINPVVKLMSEIYPQFLNRHEALCLIALLDANEIVLRSGKKIKRPEVSVLAEALAELCGEYNGGFLERHHAKTFVDVPSDIRIAYWMEEIPRLKAADEPLTYNDQNTIRRLLNEIQKSSEVRDVNFIP